MDKGINSYGDNNDWLEVGNSVYWNINRAQLLVMGILWRLPPDELTEIMSNARENN